MKKLWKKRKQINQEELKKLIEETSLSKEICELLLSRGVKSQKNFDYLVTPGIKFLSDISFIHSLQKVTDRILDALENEEKITIYGDYDCDGVIGTYILYNYLLLNEANVSYYIPSRFEDGYGLNDQAIKKIVEDGTDLIITVDNGISAIKEIDYAKSLGAEIVVTDHHSPSNELPNASALVDFKLEDNKYFKEICGAAVAYLTVLALNEILALDHSVLDEYKQLAAIATVADIVELMHFNRDILREVLEELNNGNIKNKGLLALAQQAEVTEYSPGNIGFRIAPMINAAGRIGDANQVVELFAEEDPGSLLTKAEHLQDLNKERTLTEQKILDQVEEQIINQDLSDNPVIIAVDKHWHPGVIGIVANRIQENYNRPAIIISIDEEGIAQGSCRSIKGVNILEILENSKDLFTKYGGHAMAAGFTVSEENIPKLKEEILEFTRDNEILSNNQKIIEYDIDLDPENITEEVLETLEKLAPFGVGNPEPVFRFRDVIISNPHLIGKNKDHLSFQVNGINSVFFNHTDYDELLEEGVEILARVRRNCYNNTIQFIIVDYQLNPFSSFSQAQKLINSVKTKEELEKALVGFGSRQMITRGYLIKVYKLAKKAGLRGFILKDFLTKSKTTLIDLVLALNILKEADLLNYSYRQGILSFEIFPQKQKVDLTFTKTYQMLHN